MFKYGYQSKYLTKNNKPWFPIMGEMHYSRVPQSEWKDYLYKMKAGGVMVVSTYCIWIHHEEIEGQYDFYGNKDVRDYVKLCQSCGVELILRIGPWCHGEVRNGGFPDWLLKKTFPLRENNEKYLDTIKQYFSKLYEQVDGLLLKQGGPIIGIQIENEYGHAGGLTGEDGEAHMKEITKLAKEVGFDVPYYTATGWGGAVTGGLLPVMGGYCDAPWDPRVTEIEPSGNYVFTLERNDHNIGSDYGFGHGITFDINAFPFLTAELGGGLQVTKHRRPKATGPDIGAMSLAKLGSGVNLLGYYMYAGGTNPKGVLTSLQETKATGYPNDLPELSYDFQAAIGEYGQISDTYKEIKLLAMFIHDFGEAFCEMSPVIPKDNPSTPYDVSHLRYSYRHNGHSGYVFVNNYQRHYKMSEHKAVTLSLELDKDVIVFPTFDVADKEFFFYPFHMPIGNAILESALATPLCVLNQQSYVFYTDKDPHYQLVGELEKREILTISRKEAKNAWKVLLDREHLILCEDPIIQREDTIEVLASNDIRILVYPEFEKIPSGFVRTGEEDKFTIYEKIVEIPKVNVAYQLIEEKEDSTVYEINIKYKDTENDYFLNLNYQGESAKLYQNDELIADHFYYGDAWQVGLKRFHYPTTLRLEIFKLTKETFVYLEKWPDMGENGVMFLQDVKVEGIKRINLK